MTEREEQHTDTSSGVAGGVSTFAASAGVLVFYLLIPWVKQRMGLQPQDRLPEGVETILSAAFGGVIGGIGTFVTTYFLPARIGRRRKPRSNA